MVYIYINIKSIKILFPLWFLVNIALFCTFASSPNLIAWFVHSSAFNYSLPFFLGASLNAYFAIFMRYRKKLLCSLGAIPIYFYFVRHLIGVPNLVIPMTFIVDSLAFTILIFLLATTKQVNNKIGNLGKISYSLYAIHAPLAIFFNYKKIKFF